MSYRYTLHPHERARVDGYFLPGMSAQRLHDDRDDWRGWKILRESATQTVMRHYNGAIMKVALKNGRALGPHRREYHMVGARCGHDIRSEIDVDAERDLAEAP